MPKIRASLLGFDPSGTIDNTVTYSSWLGRPYVKRHVIPYNPKTELQRGIRTVFGFLNTDYHNLSAEVKARWKEIADVDKMTPLNAQIVASQTRARESKGWIRDPAETSLAQINAPGNLTGTPLLKAVQINWTRPGANKGNYTTGIWGATVALPTLVIQRLKKIQDVTLRTAIITGLESGVQYRFRIAETDGGGKIGSQSSLLFLTPL